MCCTINKPEENCPLNQIFQLVASASTVELIQNWYIGKICNCNGNCGDTKNMINILNIIEKDFPNLTLITQILSKLIIGFQRFQENTSDASAPAGTSASSDKGVAELDTQGAAKSKSIDIAVWDDELQDMLEAQTSSFLFGLKTNYINAISGETYESKAAKGIAVAVVPPGALIQSLKKIANPITLEYGQIHGTRKFLQSVSPQHCAVLSAPSPHEENDGKFAFQGIALVSDCIRRFPIIVFRRHMQWELHLPHQEGFDDLSSTNALISYQSGRLGMPKVSADKFITARLNENATSASDLQKFLLNLLENGQNSGSIVIVGKADAIKEEAKRLYKNKRGYLFEKEVPLNSNKKFFEHIAKVDGALLCSYDYCYGYGFILDGPSVEGRADRGARHNSTQSYAASFCQNYGSNSCTVEPGKSYTLSAYVKTASMSGSGTGARLALMLSGSTVATSEAITTTKDWARLEVTYTHPATSSTSTIIPCLQSGTSGIAYFDCVQFEKSANASRYNLINNGDFRYNAGWSSNSACDSYDRRISANGAAAAEMDSYAYRIYGEATKDKRVSQTINVSGSAGDVFSVAGWAKGDSVPMVKNGNRRFAILAHFNYTTAAPEKDTDTLIEFNPGADSSVNWQYVADRIVAKKAYDSITISLLYSYNTNVVYFDGIQLFKEEFGHSYVYDSDGNVTSVTDLQKKTTTYEYSNNNLTKMTLPSGASQKYTYDSYHNVLSATSPEGVVSNFTYDSYGNNTKVTVGNGTKKVTSSATYTSNGNQLSTVTDALGQTTSYGYDTQTGILNWTQAPGETTATRTNYSHDSRYRTTGVSKGSSSVGYTYNSDLLAAISSASDTNYSFTYGVFDLISSVKVGSRALISHTYSNDANRWLTRSDYGNGDYITYTYDSFGRTTGIGYEDKTNAIGYTYDNNGNLGILTDNIAGRKTKYSYDFQDRLMRYEETASGHRNTVQWEYDDKNNLASQTQILNGTTYTTSYSYDNDNRLKQATSDGESANYTYDAYSRMTGITAKSGTKSVVATNITYKDPSTTSTSTQVYKWTVGGTTYTYTYDARGNITAVSDGSTTTTYVYDSLDQLTRENNQAAGKTWVYTYDNGGNILTKKEYSYTTGTLGTALDTITYGYGDSSWKDLLTSYDGQTLTTDAIGNLTDDGEWTYTWQHGRQLERMCRTTDINEFVYYKYDANGNRIGKTYEECLYYETGGGTVSTIRYPITATYSYSGNVLTYAYILDSSRRDSGNSTRMHFTYDEFGPMSVTYDGVEYFYLKNAQGDVTGLVNSNGAQVVTYTYDAWGNPLSTTGSMVSTLGTHNPFRYRSYFYDTETGLYCLGSRYYNPETGRFINADGYTNTQGIIGSNMFAYCGNNPQKRIDQNGCFWKEIGNFFKGVAAKITNAITSVFGAKSSTVIVGKEEKSVIPDPSPITIKYGSRTSTTVSANGDDSRPITVYQQTVVNDPWSSTVGAKSNAGYISYEYSCGLNNTSLAQSFSLGNVTHKLALKANLQEFKIGIEYSQTVKWDNQSEANYINVSINGWAIIAIYSFAQTGQWCPSPSYALIN